MENFFGGSPLAVILRLIIISIIVGIVLAALGLTPYTILDSLQRLVERVYEMGFGAVEWALQYFLLGAVIVIPVWLVVRLFKSMGGSGRH